MIESQLALDLKKVLKSLNLPVKTLHFEHPEEFSHGDYTSNFALTKFEELRTKHLKLKTPLDLAKLVAGHFPRTDYLKKVEAVPPGFINFWLSPAWLGKQVTKILKEKEKFGRSHIGKGKTILLEHTSPNIIKTLHIGHLRNNILGMATANILRFLGYNQDGPEQKPHPLS